MIKKKRNPQGSVPSENKPETLDEILGLKPKQLFINPAILMWGELRKSSFIDQAELQKQVLKELGVK